MNIVNFKNYFDFFLVILNFKPSGFKRSPYLLQKIFDNKLMRKMMFKGQLNVNTL